MVANATPRGWGEHRRKCPIIEITWYMMTSSHPRHRAWLWVHEAVVREQSPCTPVLLHTILLCSPSPYNNLHLNTHHRQRILQANAVEIPPDQGKDEYWMSLVLIPFRSLSKSIHPQIRLRCPILAIYVASDKSLIESQLLTRNAELLYLG